MKLHDVVNVLGTILLIIGVVFAFLPHELHSGLGELIGLNQDTPHEIHIVLGFVLMVVSIIILGVNNKSFKSWKEIKKSLSIR